ncbi:MAG: Calx-beta domain-containing protein [Planctomycetota bacterium]|nr:Calx-beta domain-containing protein [Planctomycetota bacterium]
MSFPLWPKWLHRSLRALRPRIGPGARPRLFRPQIEQLENRVLLAVVPPAGLVAWYRAEGNVSDFVHGNQGTLQNGATFTSGEVGQAFSFDGINDYVRIADAPELRPIDVTIEGWFNFTSPPSGTRALVGKAVGAGTKDSYQIFYESEMLQAMVCDVEGEGQRLAIPFSPTISVWYHMAYTFDDASDVQVLYLDGVAVATGATTKSIGYDNHPLLIGADTEQEAEGAFRYAGGADEVSLYNRALSATEIRAIVDAGSEGKATAEEGQQQLAFGLPDYLIAENKGIAAITVVRTGGTTGTVAVDYVIQLGTVEMDDLTIAAGTLTFAAGVSNYTLEIPIVNDIVDELDESLFLELARPVGVTLGAQASTRLTIYDDDTATISIPQIAAAEGNQGLTPVPLSVVLSVPSDRTVTASIQAFESEFNGIDIKPWLRNVIFAPGEVVQLMTLEIYGDDIDEDDEGITLQCSNLVNATFVPANPFMATTISTFVIVDDDPLPSVVFTPSPARFAEDDYSVGRGSISFELSHRTEKRVEFRFSTTDGTATSEGPFRDFPKISRVVVVPFEDRGGHLFTNPFSDKGIERDETFKLRVADPFNIIFEPQEFEFTIINDDRLPAILIEDVSIVEGNRGTTNAVLTVRLSTPWPAPISVGYATDVSGFGSTDAQPGSDFVDTRGRLYFPPLITIRQILVPVKGDLTFETFENFLVRLGNPLGGMIDDPTGKVIIFNDDPIPTFSITDARLGEGDVGANRATVKVSLSQPMYREVFCYLEFRDGSATDGKDYQSDYLRLRFSPGTRSVEFRVNVLDDSIDEADETFFALIWDADLPVLDGESVITIVDNDRPPRISIDDVSVVEPDGDSVVAAAFSVRLSQASAKQIVVFYDTFDSSAKAASDYSRTASFVILAAGETNKSIQVAVRGDLADEVNEQFIVRLRNSTNAILADREAIGLIIDNDLPPTVSIDDATNLEGNSGIGSMTFTVSLSQASSKIVRVDYATASNTADGATDFIPTLGTLTFTPGQIIKTFTVQVRGDVRYENDETFFVNMSRSFNALLARSRGIGTVRTDDFLLATALTEDEVSLADARLKDASLMRFLAAG